MRLTCPNCISEREFDDALIAVHVQEPECAACEHARQETAVLHRARGPGARP